MSDKIKRGESPREWTMADIFADKDVQIKLSIMHAVDKSLDRITVSEICKKANISRQTFYRNFDSKYSLHWWWPTYVHRFYLAEVGRTLDWETGYSHHIELLLMERDFFRVATQYTATISSLDSIMPHFRELTLLETLKDYQGVEIDNDLLFCIESWVKMETEVLTEWFRLDSTPSPQEGARRLVSIMPPALFEAVNTPALKD